MYYLDNRRWIMDNKTLAEWWWSFVRHGVESFCRRLQDWWAVVSDGSQTSQIGGVVERTTDSDDEAKQAYCRSVKNGNFGSCAEDWKKVSNLRWWNSLSSPEEISSLRWLRICSTYPISVDCVSMGYRRASNWRVRHLSDWCFGSLASTTACFRCVRHRSHWDSLGKNALLSFPMNVSRQMHSSIARDCSVLLRWWDSYVVATTTRTHNLNLSVWTSCVYLAPDMPV